MGLRLLLACGLVSLVACSIPNQPAPSSSISAAAPAVTIVPGLTATATPSPRVSSTSSVIHPGFVPVAASFISDRDGWVIGDRSLRRTTDGGTTWRTVGSAPQVRWLTFATPLVGYAWEFQSALWTTTDGGRSWHEGGLEQVWSVKIGDGVAWAIAGEGPYPKVWRAPVGSRHWQPVGMTPNRSGSLDVFGRTAYVLGEQGAGPIAPSLDVWLGARRLRNELLPGTGLHRYTPSSSLGVGVDGSVVLVDETVRDDRDERRAWRSTDDARHWRAVEPPPVRPWGVTAVRGRVFVWTEDVYVYDGKAWRLSLRAPTVHGQPGDVAFQSARHGFALTGGVLYITRDTGRTWVRVPL